MISVDYELEQFKVNQASSPWRRFWIPWVLWYYTVI